MGRIVTKCFESLTTPSLTTAVKQHTVVSDNITLLLWIGMLSTQTTNETYKSQDV